MKNSKPLSYAHILTLLMNIDLFALYAYIDNYIVIIRKLESHLGNK